MKEDKKTYEEILRQGQPLAVPIHGKRMRPLLSVDDTTVVEPLSVPLRKGDLPLYKRRNGGYVIQRIIRLKGHNYWTVGDNSHLIEYVSQKQILGIVTQIYHNGKYICVTDKKYKAYVWLWMRLAPMRIAVGRLRSWIRN